MKGKNVMMKKVADMYLLLDIVDYVPGVVRGSYRWSSLGCSHTNGYQQPHPTSLSIILYLFLFFSPSVLVPQLVFNMYLPQEHTYI